MVLWGIKEKWWWLGMGQSIIKIGEMSHKTEPEMGIYNA